jgi:hypothetical protein
VGALEVQLTPEDLAALEAALPHDKVMGGEGGAACDQQLDPTPRWQA